MSADYTKRVISKEELAKHDTEEDCWMAIHGVVYDLSAFVGEHPGGPDVVVVEAGKDATQEFEDIGHSISAREMASDYAIGILEGWEGKAQGMSAPPKERRLQKQAEKSFSLVPVLIITALVGVVAAVASLNK